MNPEISSETRLIALLGDPVEHSLSPTFQNAAILSAGLNAAYLALRCDAGDVAGLVAGISRSGGAGNVTVPHKEIAARVIERPMEAMVRTGACNTFWLEGGQICGDNTDVTGVAAATRSLLGRSTRGASVLLLGAGGAARAVAFALAVDGADRVVVLNRSPERAEELRLRFSTDRTAIQIGRDVDSLRGEAFDLVINATSLGLRPGDRLPLPIDSDISVGAALDLVYAPAETEWVRALRDRGVPATDGLEMLLQQGAAAFERWWGRAAPIEAMRAALKGRR